VSEFDDIYKKLEEQYEDYDVEKLGMGNRRRTVGGGKQLNFL